MIPPILMYHRVADCPGDRNAVSPRVFELQLQYLEDQGYRTLGLLEWHQMIARGEKTPQKSVILTFDDGYRDNWENAMPLLVRYGFTGTVFVVSGLIGGKNEWDGHVARRGVDMMRASDLREWHEAGLEIGSHGTRHQRVTQFSGSYLQEELSRSKKTLEDLLGEPVPFFCYPNGDLNEEVIEALKAVGYLGATAIYDGASWDNNPIDWYRLPRLRASDKDEPGVFRWKISPYHSWLGKSRQWEKKIKNIFKS